MFCLVGFVLQQKHRIGLIPAVLWGYVIGSALVILEMTWRVPFGQFNPAFLGTSGQTLAEAILIPTFLLSLPNRFFNKWRYVFIVVSLIEIFCVWTFGTGIMIAQSFDNSLVAMFIPFAPLWLIVTSVITILFHHGSTAMMVIAAQGLVLSFFNKRIRIIMLFLIPIIVVVAYLHSIGPMLDGTERIVVWKSLINHWWKETAITQTTPDGMVYLALKIGGDWWTRIFGIGAGSFMFLSIILEPKRMFLSAHSEPVQILFELGMFGLFLTLATVLYAAFQVRRNPKLLSAIAGVCACSLTYHPLRWFPTALLICCIFREALLNENGHEVIMAESRKRIFNYLSNKIRYSYLHQKWQWILCRVPKLSFLQRFPLDKKYLLRLLEPKIDSLQNSQELRNK